MSQYRYPGAQPFSSEQQHLFFGRDEDIARLHRLVKTQRLSLLYGKSGLGKSSLLNAGLLPRIEKDGEYIPVPVRFNAWIEGKKDTPVDIVLNVLSPYGSRNTFLDSLIKDEPSLWHELKEAQIADRKKYLLVFDQFEELFTYPPESIAAFKDQMAEALYTRIPDRYRAVLEAQLETDTCALTNAEFEVLQAQPDVRIVLSIRSDRMHLMERLSDALPDILSHCYELGALTRAGTQAAIVAPAALPGDFLAAPFGFSAEALSEIIAFLDDQEGRVETIQLQILCRDFEERAAKEGLRFFDKNNLGDLGAVITGFYHRQLSVLGDEAAQQPARRLIEDGLIVVEDKQRLMLHEAQISSLFKVPKEHLRLLVNGGLLRAEPALRGGGYTYELSHDTLVEPALVARRERKLREENAALTEERQKRERTRNIAIGFALLATLSLGAAVYAWGQTQKAWRAEAEAVRQKEEAFSQKNRADEQQRFAELSAQEALSAKDSAEYQKLLAQEAEKVASTLATKGQRLEGTISGEDTYGFLMQKGKEYLSKNGDYRNALTYFATAQFTDDRPESRNMLVLAQKGIQAEALFFEGKLAAAKPLYRAILAVAPEAKAAERIEQMANAEAALQELLKEGGPSFSLSGKGLGTLPEKFGDLPDAQRLDVSGNYFPALPPPLLRLKDLRILILTDGSLEQLPTNWAALKQLKILDLTNNVSLNKTPISIGQLKNLEELYLAQTGFDVFPVETNMLQHLRILDLGRTPLKMLPNNPTWEQTLQKLGLAGMKQLNWEVSFPILFRLKNLKELNLSGNNLPPLPEGFGAMQSLSMLDISANGLKQLPPDFANLKNLKHLILTDNSFDEATKAKIRQLLPNCVVEF